MNEHLIPIFDEFLDDCVIDQKCFADDETRARAREAGDGGGDIIPLSYNRTLVDPDDASRLLVGFCYGTDSFEHEQLAPGRVKQCMDALSVAHPEVAAVPVRLLVTAF